MTPNFSQRRVPILLLPLLAQTLGTTTDGLTSQQAARISCKRGPTLKIQQLEQIEALPKAKQRVIAQVLDSMLGLR